MTNNSRSPIFQLKPRALSIAVVLVVLAHTSVYADSSYGPIVQGETLSKIVNENYPVSEYSDTIIMREIFRENPESFIANNMGLLKQSVKLILPDDNSIRRSLVSQGVAVKSVPTTSKVASLVTSTRAVAGSNRIITVQESLRLVRAERDDLKSSLSQAKTELSSLESRFESAQNRLSEIESKPVATSPVIQNDKALTSLEESLNKAISEREAVKVQLVDAQSQFDSLQVKLDTALDVTSGLEVKLETAQSVESELNAKLETALSAESELTAKLSAANLELTDSKAAMAITAKSLAALEQGSSQQSAALVGMELTKQSLEKSNTLIVEKDKRITDLEVSIEDLKKQLGDASDAESAAVEASDTAQRVEADKVIADLNQQLVVYKDEVEELRFQNDELVSELMAAPAGDLDSAMDIDLLVDDTLLPGSALVADTNDIFEGESNNNFLTKSITLPTWSALLALLALGLTGLMVLLGRRNKSTQLVSSDASGSNDLVFKSGNLDARDQDVEALRVPPRRDPSRVAILDPSMNGEQVSTPNTLAAQENSVTPEQPDSNDADLKLAMAEAYIDLSDTQAANELLHEVLLEGTSQQQSSAELLMARLAG